MYSNITRRTISAAAAIAIAGTGIGASAMTEAFAQPVEISDTVVSAEDGKGPLAATFPDGTSNLTLHKRVNPSETKENRKGAEETGETPGKSAGEGYTFTLTKVADGNQIKDQDVFNALAGLSQTQSRDIASRINANETLKSNNISAPANDATADYTLDTNSEGVASQNDIPNGVYLVKETKSPEDTTSKVHPFLVFLPQPDPDADTKAVAAPGDWNTDVHVYPKNGRTNINKTVVDAGKHVGDTISYTLTAEVPSSAQNETLTKFVLNDMFNNAELGEFSIESASVAHRDGSSEAVTPTQGDAVALDTPSNLGSNTSINYTVDPQNLKGGDVVSINLKAKLLDTRQDSEIINQARTIVRHSGDDADHQTTPVDVRTYVGDIELTKFNDKNKDGAKAEDEDVIEGAEFELYSTREAAEARANDLEGQPGESLVATATTGKDGKATFSGIHVTDFQNGAEVSDDSLHYYLVEVVVPEGFVTPDAGNNVREMTLTRADDNTADPGSPMLLVSDQHEIPNIPDDRVIPQLPVTGQSGVITMGILALLLLGGAGAFAASRNRKIA